MLRYLADGPLTTRELGDRARAEMYELYGRWNGAGDPARGTVACVPRPRLARLERLGLIERIQLQPGWEILWVSVVTEDGLARSDAQRLQEEEW